jgi:hypothetical protein
LFFETLKRHEKASECITAVAHAVIAAILHTARFNREGVNHSMHDSLVPAAELDCGAETTRVAAPRTRVTCPVTNHFEQQFVAGANYSLMWSGNFPLRATDHGTAVAART